MPKKYTILFKWIIVIVDYLLLNISFLLSFLVINRNLEAMSIYDFRLILLLSNLSWFFCSNIFDLYNNILKREAVPTMTSNIASLGLYLLLLVNMKIILPYLNISIVSLASLVVIFSSLLMLWRFSFLLMRKYRRQFWIENTNVVIVGTGPVGISLYNYINSNPQLGYNVLGIFGDKGAQPEPGLVYLGRAEDCMDYASTQGVHEIYCALPTGEPDRIERLMQEADNHLIRFRLVPDVKGSFERNFMVELYGFMPVLIPRQEPLNNKANEVVKRVFDVLFSSLVVLFLLSWLIPFLGIIIKLDSRGPVFFKQLRSGKNNKPFYCLKFRSMAVNDESDILQTKRGDTRITRVGKFIRQTSIDELPQFLNVLMGNMSVVGPRPHMLKHTQDYSPIINNYMVRQFLTPGITGWAQVRGYRGETLETNAMTHRIQADLWYLENWSMILDLKIVFLTIWQVFKGNENAY
ncbi:undecaprenyl-phosphate glucose phosphotransferase [Pontibacter mangrovi]|uniref:Undecaprenyl-phosphate glucose phosphotransferase n=1 Tax=Pontibacter mangrovi TaxID=2589816 RepID=A0A501W840_9BACT|nr:undecaprenyl-phosphate glucose phosphotransferase [Pontibacter mangrovi]TPE42987.1 undecaprenyl-phosphate glucose phosphotransferase [Pontibacter mangrovi]